QPGGGRELPHERRRVPDADPPVKARALRLAVHLASAAGAASLLAAPLVAAGPVDRQHLGPPVPAHVRRIVTLAPSLTELVLGLAAKDRLEGVTRFDEDPAVSSLPRVGGFNDPEPETVLGLRPDLVLAQTGPENRGPVEALARLGVPVEAFALGTVE